MFETYLFTMFTSHKSRLPSFDENQMVRSFIVNFYLYYFLTHNDTISFVYNSADPLTRTQQRKDSNKACKAKTINK